MNRKIKKGLKISLITVSCVIIVIIAFLGSYVAYVAIQYSRIDDKQNLEIENPIRSKVIIDESYDLVTYNIGFGAYSHDFSFFMDSGTMKSGEKVSGVNSKAKDKETVLFNTNGAISEVKKTGADFVFLQEADIEATRSRKVNQYSLFKDSFAGYTSTYAENFHSAYLMYPLNDFHGKTNAGLVTLSSRRIDNAERRSLPVDNSFPTKFFDLDRCISVNRLPIEGSTKFLTLINVHLSAYDEGGTIRALQMEFLNTVLSAEAEAGNYVVAGGDFNHDIAGSKELFSSEQLVPEWVYELSDSDLPSGFKFVSSTNAPTCRSTDMKYEKGVNYTVVIDGFIVSAGVEVVSNKNIDTDFMYSDHNPAQMTFKLTA